MNVEYGYAIVIPIAFLIAVGVFTIPPVEGNVEDVENQSRKKTSQNPCPAQNQRRN